MSWVPFVLLALVAGMLVAAPLLRKVRPPRPREEYDRQVFRDQLRELEEDKERGLLTPEQEAAARLEIDRRLLGASKTGYRSPGKLPLWQTAILLAVLVPAVSLGLYLWRGAPQIPGQPLAARTDLVAPVESREILELIAEQQAALAQDPQNTDAWVLLGRGLLVSGRFEEAADAFRHAVDLGRNDADTLMEMVEALLNQSGGTITPAAGAAIDAAFAADPLHPAARYYRGLAHSQAGEPQQAYDIWLALAADTPGDAPWLPLVRRQLEQAAAQLGIELDPAVAAPPAAAGIAALTPEEQQTLIESMVAQLAARLEENPEDPDGWMRLAQSYQVLGRGDDAVAAIARAAALRPDDPGILLQQAAVLMDNTPDGAPFPDLVRTSLDRTLTLEPQNVEALYYAGLVAEAGGEIAEARALWQRLLDLLDPDGGAHAEVLARIQSLAAE